MSIGKIRPTEVKEITLSVQVEASTSRQGEPQVDLEASTSGTHQMMEMRMYNKMNLIDLLLHLYGRATTPTTTKKDKRKNKTMKRMFHPDQNKSSQEFEQESQEIIPSNKSSMIFKPGELLALKLVGLTSVNITHSFLALNL